jgi:hypothetical protein
MFFEVILYFYYGYFLSSWNQIGILDLNWDLMFEIPVFVVAYTTLRLYCTDMDTSKGM